MRTTAGHQEASHVARRGRETSHSMHVRPAFTDASSGARSVLGGRSLISLRKLEPLGPQLASSSGRLLMIASCLCV